MRLSGYEHNNSFCRAFRRGLLYGLLYDVSLAVEFW